MKVGVLGSGVVATTLASGFLKHGHEAMLGTRSPAKLADWKKHNARGRVGSFAEAAKFGELVVLAVKGTVAAEALRAADQRRAQVLHQPRRLADGAPAARVPRRAIRQGLQLRRQRLDGQPELQGGKSTMFICGNDDAAKQAVSRLCDQFGWEVADMGKAEAARAIEPLCML
jgi:predicted dinucleotide-binding enzyme